LNRYLRSIIAVVFIVMVVMLLTRSTPWNVMGKGPQRITASEAQDKIIAGEVASGSLTNDAFTFTAKRGAKYETTIAQPGDQTEFIKLLNAHHVKYSFDKSPFSGPLISMLLSIVLPLGFLVVLWMLFMRQAQAGNNQAMSFGRSKAKRLNENVPKITFDDVAGVDYRGGKAIPPRLLQQVGFDGGLADAVFLEGLAGLILGGWHDRVKPVHPDRAAMQKPLDQPA